MASPRARTCTITVFMPYSMTLSYISETLALNSFSVLSCKKTSISKKEIQQAFLPLSAGAAFVLISMAGDTANREISKMYDRRQESIF